MVTPFLMFEGAAEEAISFYIATIPGSRLIEIQKYGSGGPGREGSVLFGRASLGGRDVAFSDSPIHHDFTFTPSISLLVDCSSDEEIERLTGTLVAGGDTLMPLDNYGFCRRFAWVKDRFGVTWQLKLGEVVVG